MSSKKHVLFYWLKWIGISGVILAIGLIIYGMVTIHQIQAERDAGFAKTEETVIEKTDIVSVEHIDVFHEAISYHIVFGTTERGNDKVVFVPINDSDADMMTFNRTDMMTEQDIEKEWNETCQSCELLDIQAAMIESNPLWELTYKDEHDRHVLDYVSMQDGQRYEQLRFKRNFK
ncbi:DUF5590 domain-containing protein [Lentibacillus saliphilus]|uniref:cell wall elongation regulator TseB-like domain-containing protein n=1 Tax=Lentibacillus saliphilus TaxID=2737028 RepID=UPI001C30FAC1|nr:DUF5590 domain-containing protein [Lentibacillus saliphilus]